MITIRAITPRRLPMATNTRALLEEQLGRTGFAGKVIDDLANYPPQQPRVGERQSLGRRAGNRLKKRAFIRRGYRRTGRLGKGWRFGPYNGRVRRRGADLVVEVVNRVPYGIPVQGPRPGAIRRRQTDEMYRRRWPNVTEVSRRRWREHRQLVVRILAQRDPRQAYPPTRSNATGSGLTTT